MGTVGALITAGRCLFAERGYAGTSVRAVTTAAGANLGAITYHFGSKRGLYSAVLEDALTPMAQRVASAASEPGTALDRMLLVVRTWFEQLRTNPELPRLILQEISAGRRPPEAIVGPVQRIVTTLDGICGEGEADGSMRPTDCTLTVLSVVAQLLFATAVGDILRDAMAPDRNDAVAHERVVGHTLSFVSEALRSRAEAVS